MLIIADDLTGASDTAVQYRKNGYSAMVCVSYPGAVPAADEHIPEEYDVVSVNSDTRPLCGPSAYDKVYRITKELYRPGVEIYKKMDSVLRGNPGPELEAVMDAAGFDVALAAPSFPETGRKIVDGILRVGDREFSVPELFSATMKRKVEAVSIGRVRSGAESLYDYIKARRQSGVQVFVLDSETDEDLRIVAEAAEEAEAAGERCVMCGSAGLAKQLRPRQRDRAAADIPSGTDILAVVGSRCQETAAQVRRAVEKGLPLVLMDTQEILQGGAREAEDRCAEQILRKWQEGSCAVITAVDSLFGESGFVLKEKEQEYGRAKQIADSLGNVIRKVFSRRRADVIISVGGDTSQQICQAVGAAGIEILYEIMPGVPAGRLIGGQGAGICIITKSGGFGGEETLLEILDHIEGQKKEKENEHV